MKQCLSVLMILAAVAANAENNPFDLQENLQKIERAQSIFLDELKFLVQQKEASQKDEHEHGVFTEANTEENRSAAIETVQHIQTAAESSNLIEKETEDTQALNTEEKKPLLPKEEQAITDQKIAKHEEEKKLLRLNEAEGKAEKEKSVTARIQDINISKERLEAKQNADKDYQEAIQEMDGEK